jgi:hypothetical protein
LPDGAGGVAELLSAPFSDGSIAVSAVATYAVALGAAPGGYSDGRFRHLFSLGLLNAVLHRDRLYVGSALGGSVDCGATAHLPPTAHLRSPSALNAAPPQAAEAQQCTPGAARFAVFEAGVDGVSDVDTLELERCASLALPACALRAGGPTHVAPRGGPTHVAPYPARRLKEAAKRANDDVEKAEQRRADKQRREAALALARKQGAC